MTILLQNFPTEILETILGNLCLHCHDGSATSVPDLDTPCGREDQRSLAALCRMSRSLCNVAQPILFHQFSISSHHGSSQSTRPGAHLFQFIRTLSTRPDLARAVRAVELLPPPGWKDAYSVDEPTWDAWRRRWRRRDWDSDEEEDEAMIRMSEQERETLPLTDLVPSLVGMTTKLEYLRLVAPSQDKFDGWCDDVVPVLERMRVLELVSSSSSSSSDQHFRMVDLPNVVRVMPNLQSLRASSQMRLSCTHHFSLDDSRHAYGPNLCSHRPWEIIPAGLTKAVLGHVDLFRLGTLLDSCSRLEDLEMFLAPGTYDWENAMPSDGALVAARPSLRRLVVTMHDWLGWTRFPGMFEKKTGGAGIAYQANMAFRKMEVLEELAVDQCLLHADVVHATTGGDGESEGLGVDKLSAALPDSLRSLHVGYVVSWQHLQPQLRDLVARRKAGYFPDLTTIRVDPYIPVSNAHLAAERAVMADLGIKFVVGTNQPIRSGQSQQMLTPSAGSRFED